jgi:hypothetical protein
MSPDDFDAWKPQDPPADFAARVVATARAEGRGHGRPTSGKRALTGVLLVGTLAAGVAVAVHVRSASSHGDVAADGRREVRVGSRAVAVLERGAHVTWDGEAVTQSSGDVFWRVEPGSPLMVHAAGAEVTVKGTCFRVSVRGGGDEDTMKARNGIAGALAATVVVVGVYEGRVALSRERTSVELSAGEEGIADREGARRSGEGTVAALDHPAGPVAPADHALAALDRGRADHLREQLRALFAEGGVRALPGAPLEPHPPAPSASAVRTMPLVPDGDGGPGKIDPSYIQSVVRNDYFPLAKQCYANALERNPRLAGTIEMSFRILGGPGIGGVVDDAKLGDGTTIDDAELRTCMRESMMSVTFDAPPEGGEVTVVYPIRFSPDDDDGDAGGR